MSSYEVLAAVGSAIKLAQLDPFTPGSLHSSTEKLVNGVLGIHYAAYLLTETGDPQTIEEVWNRVRGLNLQAWELPNQPPEYALELASIMRDELQGLWRFIWKSVRAGMFSKFVKCPICRTPNTCGGGAWPKVQCSGIECVVCMDAEVDTVFTACGHAVVCGDCAAQL